MGNGSKRKGLSKRVRFEIFKRDGFKCRYCGVTAVGEQLTVDHVVAVANGGTDAPENLVTCCASCNGGKSAVPIDQRRFDSGQTAEAVREHAEQVKEYLEAAKELADAKRAVAVWFVQEFERVVGYAIPPDLARRSGHLTSAYPLAMLVEAMHATANAATYKLHTNYALTKYFHGVLRNMREESAA